MSIKFANQLKAEGKVYDYKKRNTFKKNYWRTECKDPSRTRQEFSKICDINRIVDKYHRTGVLTHVRGPGMYGDVSQFQDMDYRECIEFVEKANKDFEGLDVNLRNKFDNDPQKLINFLDNPENREEAIKMGIFKKPIPVKPEEPAPVVEPSTNVVEPSTNVEEKK